MPSVQQRTVSRAEAGQKLLQFLLRVTKKGVPQSAILKWIRTGQVRVDKGRAKPYDRVAEGQVVRIPPYEAAESIPELSGKPKTELPVVFEDDQLMAVNKPHGLPTQPGSAHVDSVVTRLKLRFADADFVPTPAHRLDRDTTGVLLVAKTYEALRQVSDQLASRLVGKTYLAWVAGEWEHDEPLFMEDTLAKTRERGRQEKTGRAQDGKFASATATMLRREPGRTLLKVDLHTGRSNQIRAQLALRGHPIVGDRKYGGPPLTPHQLLLHCHVITLPNRDPITCPPVWPGDYAV